MFRKVFRNEMRDYPKAMLLCGGAVVGFWLFGVLLSLLIRFTEGDLFYIPLGGIMSAFGGVFALIFSLASSYSAGFELSVKMGATRRGYLIGESLFALFLAVSSMAVSLAMILLEIPVGMLVAEEWRTNGLALTFEVVSFVPWYIWAAIPFAVVIIGMFAGALFSRFGRTAFWIMYLVFFTPVWLGSPIAEIIESGDTSTPIGRIIVSAAQALAAVPIGVWIALGCLIPVVLAVFAVWSLMKQEIKA